MTGSSRLVAGSAAPAHHGPRAATPLVLPFELVGDLIVFEASVGATPARLLLDTGSALSSLDESWALGVGRVVVHDELVRATGTDVKEVRLATAALRLGPLELGEQTVLLLDLAEVNRAKGAKANGVLGFDFLDRFVVEVDYDRRQLRLNSPVGSCYSGPGSIVPVSLDMRIPVAAVTLAAPRRDPVTVPLVLDLGSTALSLRLSPRLMSAYPGELGGLSRIEAVLGTGIGGLALGSVTRLEALRLGDLVFPGPTVGIAHEQKGFFTLFDGSVGVPVFRRARTIIDYPHRRFIFEPGPGIEDPPTYDASGLYLVAPRADEAAVEVAFIVPGGPGAEAGLRIGDRIIELDERAVTAAGLNDLRTALQAAGRACTLTIRRGEAILRARLSLRTLV